MEIILLRHGKVNYPPLSILSASAFSDWVESYNTSTLDIASLPPDEVISIAKQSNAVVCSDLIRSQESAKLLKIEHITHCDPLFNEAGLPIANWNFPRLSVRIWVILFRALWFLGYSQNSESLSQAKVRSYQAAEKLIELAEKHNSVVFIGHGIFNRLLANELRESGWCGPKSPGNKYWEFGVYKNK